MAEIQLAIEGESAVPATEALLQIPGLSGTWESKSGNQRETVLATVATIVAITGGTLTIAEQIHKWYQKYRQGQSDKRIEKVLIVGKNGQRFLLEDATIEQIRQILDS